MRSSISTAMINIAATDGPRPGSEPLTSTINSISTTSTNHANSNVARSRPHKPGITRRAGSTAKLVSDCTNSDSGLRVAARHHCSQKRNSSTDAKKPKTA